MAELEAQLASVMAGWAAERELWMERIRVLEGRVADLEKTAGRNSSNSSKPPSSDSGPTKSDRPVNANRAARRALGRSQGKQRGAEGHTLSQVSDPDTVESHRPVACRRCQRGLDDAETVTVVFTESQPAFSKKVQYRVIDGALGTVEKGWYHNDDAYNAQPWLPDGPIPHTITWTLPGYVAPGVPYPGTGGRT